MAKLPSEGLQDGGPAAWWLVAVLFLTGLISYTDRLILSVLVDPLRADLGLSDSVVGLLQGLAFTLVYVTAALVFGRLVDRYNPKPLLVFGSALWCCACVLCGLAPNAATLLVGRLLLGMGEAALIPAAISMLSNAFAADRRGLALGMFVMSTVIGGPLGITIGGFLLSAARGGAFACWPLLDALAPWRTVLVMVGAAGALSPFLLMTVRTYRTNMDQTDCAGEGASQYFRSNSRRLAPLYAAMAFLAIGDYGLVSWIPTALSRRFEWPSDRVGLAFGIITALAGVLGSLGGGGLSDIGQRRNGTRGRLTVSIIGALLAGTGALIVSGGHADAVLTGLGMWVFASTVGAVSAIAVIQSSIPDRYRGTAVALLTLSNTLFGLGCGPSLVAFTTEHLYRAPAAVDWSVSTVGGAVAAFALALFWRSRKVITVS